MLMERLIFSLICDLTKAQSSLHGGHKTMQFWGMTCSIVWYTNANAGLHWLVYSYGTKVYAWSSAASFCTIRSLLMYMQEPLLIHHLIIQVGQPRLLQNTLKQNPVSVFDIIWYYQSVLSMFALLPLEVIAQFHCSVLYLNTAVRGKVTTVLRTAFYKSGSRWLDTKSLT